MDINSVVAFVLASGMVVLLLGAPVGPLLMFAGVLGLFLLTDSFEAATSLMLATGYDVGSAVGYVVIPMFILMGALAGQTGIIQDLYTAAYRAVGRFAGGLAIATCLAAAAFGAVTGSSISSASAMAKIALPEMQRYGYSPRLSAGVIAVSGTFAMMLPPSLIIVFYSIVAQQSIGKMLIAGIFPGLFTVMIFALLILVRARINPSMAPAGPKFPISETAKATVKASPFILVLLTLIGGILLGVWTPTEASAGGVVVVTLIGFAKRNLTISKIFTASIDSVMTAAAVLLLVMGSIVFGKFLALSGVTSAAIGLINDANLSSIELFLVLIAFYIILGTFMEGISILALTIPIVMPIIQTAGWDPIWFGIILVKLIEIGAVTPPVGLNLFAVSSVAKDVKTTDIILGAMPFWITEIGILFILFAIPSIVTFLPSLM